MNLLMILFVVPFLCAALMFLLPVKNVKWWAFGFSLIPLIILIAGHPGWLGSEIKYAWLPQLAINFHLSVDSLSLVFLYLTAVIVPISILSVNEGNLLHPNVLYGLVLFLQGLLIGFFTARDLVVFTIFWEGMLLPLYFIITIWGGTKRQMAGIKFLIYMIAGSALMVVAILFLYFTTGTNSFNIDDLANISKATPYLGWAFFIFMLAFAVKTPLFPFHAWLPDAYYEAPVIGTILLSALLSKAGIYGILRIGGEIFPSYLIDWSLPLIGLAFAGTFYGGFAAWMQKDYKRLIAYSSLSHVNFILVGLFVMNQTAQSGAILQALNHGVTIAALFLVAGWLEYRLGSTALGEVGGLAKFMPQLCWLTLFFVLSAVALPGTNNFVGELLILFGLFMGSPWLAAFLCLTVILSVLYMLRWMQKVYFQEPSFFQDSWVDIKGKEIAIALPLIALILWIGIYPAPVLKQTSQAAEKITTFANMETTR